MGAKEGRFGIFETRAATGGKRPYQNILRAFSINATVASCVLGEMRR